MAVYFNNFNNKFRCLIISYAQKRNKMKMHWRLKRMKEKYYMLMKEKYYMLKFSTASPGTKEWLIGAEIKYGGFIANVPRNKVSLKDPRTKEQLRKGGMIGGDRMLHHGYASKYSEYLFPYIGKDRTITVAEFGILKGTGLAIWCDLFIGGRVLGLDIDLGHVNDNMDNLRAFGAFKSNQPELYEFDQFENNIEYLGTILKGDKIDVCIDDGCHSIESILNTMKSVMRYLADEAVYIIEDNRDVHKEIKTIYPDLLVDYENELTIVSKPGRKSA